MRQDGRGTRRLGARPLGVRPLGAATLAVMLVAAAGCSPIVRTHGYAPNDTALADIAPGMDTVATVTSKIGRPSTGGVVRNDVWFYVASRTETMTWNAPEVTERRVIVVRFDQDGVVEGVDRFGLEDGRVVNLVTRTTPTFGRELTVLQQIFGNIGNVGGAIEQSLDE